MDFDSYSIYSFVDINVWHMLIIAVLGQSTLMIHPSIQTILTFAENSLKV